MELYPETKRKQKHVASDNILGCNLKKLNIKVV